MGLLHKILKYSLNAQKRQTHAYAWNAQRCFRGCKTISQKVLRKLPDLSSSNLYPGPTNSIYIYKYIHMSVCVWVGCGCGCVHLCVWGCVCVCVCVCVWEREREKVSECVCVCVISFCRSNERKFNILKWIGLQINLRFFLFISHW